MGASYGTWPFCSYEEMAEDLWEAVYDSDVSKVSGLLRRGADPNHPLFWRQEWIDEVKDGRPSNPRFPPIHQACRSYDLTIVKLLVTEGKADVNRGDGKYNRTALHMACEKGDKEVALYLMNEVKCTLDVRDDQGKSPLTIALTNAGLYKEGRIYVALYLINHGCGYDKDKDKLLCEACYWGNLEVVKELIEQHKVDSRIVRDSKGQSPLDIALRYAYYNEGCFKIAVYLNNCDCDAVNKKNRAKLLCAAAKRGNLDSVKELVEQHKIYPNKVRDDKGLSPLDLALGVWCKDVSFETALYLINRGCGGDKDKIKLLFQACKKGNLDVVKELVEQHNVNSNNVRDEKKLTPLHHASENGHKDLVVYLVQKANSNEISQEDSEPAESDIVVTLEDTPTNTASTSQPATAALANCRSLTTEALKEMFELNDTQLNSEINETDVYHLAGYFDEVRPYVVALKLPRAVCTDATRKGDIHTGMSYALSKWLGANPFTATFTSLLNVLLSMEKGEIACDVCEYLSKKSDPDSATTATTTRKRSLTNAKVGASNPKRRK